MIPPLVYSTLAHLVGGRVYPVTLPDVPVYPALRYSFVSITEEPFVDANQVIQRYRVQVDAYAKTYAQAFALRGEVLSAVRALPEFVEQGVDFDGYEPETKIFRWTVDFVLRDLTPA